MRNILWPIATVTLLTFVGCNRQEPATQANAPDSRAAATSDPFRPVANVKQVMLGITIPASNAVFAVAGEAPADDAAWQAVEASALAVAESGNLLLMKPRAVDDREWKQFALALVDAGAKAAEAARAKDADKTSIAGDDMYNACEQCHAKYMPKPALSNPR
jgi:hypothetical protein